MPHAAPPFRHPFPRSGGDVRGLASTLGAILIASLFIASTLAGLGYERLTTHGNSSPNGLATPQSPAAGLSFRVELQEAGLADGTNWSANLTVRSTGTQLTNWSTTNELNFTVPNGTYAFWVANVAGYSPSPAAGNITVAGSPVIQYVGFTKPATHFQVSFIESGLPVNWTWVVIFNGSFSQTQVATKLSFECANGTYSYSVGQTGSYVPTPAFGNVSVSGTGLLIPVTFLAPTVYAVTFRETVPAQGSAWYAWVGGATADSSTNTLTLNLTNGRYANVLDADSATVGYVSSESPGNLTVNGSSVTIDVTFVRAPYLLTFIESGLPANTAFTTWLSGVGGEGQGGVGSVAFYVVDGNYSYWIPPVWGYLPVTPDGNVTIHGSSVTVPVVFAPEDYELSFNESGLALPEKWTVIVDGTEGQTSYNSSQSVPIGNGTFQFLVWSPAGYIVSPSVGSVTVRGANLTVAVTFTSTVNDPRYAATFSEAGLPPGSAWSIEVNGTFASGTGSAITLELLNGTYWYEIHAPSDYSAVVYFASFTVDDHNLSFSIQFFDVVESAFSVTFVETGLPAGTQWTVDFNGENSSSFSTAITFT